MKNFDLNAYGVEEMNVKEMEIIEGGSIFSKIGDAISVAIDAMGEACVWLWGNVLSQPLVLEF